MEDLAAPAPKQTPEARPVSYSVNSTFNPPSAPAPSQSNQSYQQPAPVVSHYQPPEPTPAPKNPPPSSNANIDDLDALMESLNASSSRNSRKVQPVSAQSSFNSSLQINPTPQKTATPAYNPPQAAPKQQSSNIYNPPATTVYNPPATPAYNPPAPTPAYNPPASNHAYNPPQERRPDPVPVRNNTYSAPPPVQRKGDDLDSLLQNLSSQMNSIDSDNPASRGTCWTCKGAILGEVIQALGKAFHPEHFSCGNCRSPLGTTNFYEHNGTPHCERCYQELYCPKCAHCDGPVLDRCITALGKKWHVDHFICTQCLKPFQGGNFFERDGRPYCEQDFYGLYAPKCAGCNEAVRGDCINALGSQWHPEHFACSYCQKSFAGGSFFEYAGKPYCEIHYHQQTGSLCAGCGKAITGRCVNALDKKWHPEHFVCAFCMNPLAGGSFTEHNNKAYCKECHGKLWSTA